jgi:hypothetical protein
MSDAAHTPDPNAVLVDKRDLEKLQEGFKLLSSLWDHPEHGAEIKLRAKKIRPDLRVPEIDVAEPLLKPIREQLTAKEEEIKKQNERLEKLETSIEDDKQLAKLERDIDKAVKKHRLTGEGKTELIEIMKRGEANTPEAAASIIVANLEPVKPVTGTNFGPSDANILGISGDSPEDDIKALHQDPVKWLDRAIPSILSEVEESEAA